jgi:hypothetical protein
MANELVIPSARSAGVAIALASILSVAVMAHHPTTHARGPADIAADITRQALVDQVVHGSLIALMAVLLYGFSCWASLLGLHFFTVRAGLIIYSLGIIVAVLAALIDGFIIPDVARHYQNRSISDLEAMQHLLTLCAIAIRVCARLWVIATSIAFILWSVALFRAHGLSCLVGAIGFMAGGLPIVALLSGYLPMSVHGVLAFVLAQTVWSLAVAALLLWSDVKPAEIAGGSR